MWSCGHVAVGIIRRVHGYGVIGYEGRILVEGVAGVVVGGGQGEAVGALFAVTDVVVLVGAVGGGAGLVFGFDLA